MSVMSSARLTMARRLMWRDWKSGELNILAFSLLLAIGTVTCISLFTSRIHNSIFEEAAHFLAADAKVSGSLPIPKAWQTQANTLKLRSAHTINFRAMAFAGENMALGQVKAVSNDYPLKGSLHITDAPYGPEREKTTGPQPGTVWLAPRLFNALNISVGDTISIGEADFNVSAVISKEPDSGQSLFGVAPRVMMHMDDVTRTAAVQTGSRINYHWLLAGDNIDAMNTWLTPQLGEHFRWQGVSGGNIGLDSAITRAERFLLLTGCLSVVLSGVAIALAARRYAKRQHNHVALLKTFGSTPKAISQLYALGLLSIGITAIALGALLGWLLHWGIIAALGDLMPTNLAKPHWSAYGTGAITGFISLWAFAAPPIWALRHVSPAAVLREGASEQAFRATHTLIGFSAIIGMMFFYSRDLSLTLIVTAGASLCVIGVSLLSALLIYATKPLSQGLGISWRLGLANLKRHKQFNTLQVVIFSLLFLLLFILLTVRTSLLNQWQDQLPEDTPNHFIFNIFPAEADGIRTFLDENNIDANPFYPMTRGRVIQLNETDIAPLVEASNSRVNYERELNLTWSATLGSDNDIIAGTWWDALAASDTLRVSAESTYAEGLNMQVGDTLTFSVAGQSITAEIASIRSVQWDSMNPNFYMIFDRPLLDGMSANWITSFYLAPENKSVLNALARRHPTLSIIEIDQTIAQIQSIVNKVSLAIEFILVLVLVSGLLVLVTSIQATLDLRMKEGAIYRTLGAPKALVRRTLLIEFSTLGLLSGILAVAGTELCLYFLQTRVFSLEYASQYHLWLWGPTLGAALIGIVGWLSARSVVRTTPLSLLRNA